MLGFSSLSPVEEYRLTGTLCPETLENVMETNELVESMRSSVRDALCNIREARGCFISKDALDGLKADLLKRAQVVKGEARNILVWVCDLLDEVSVELNQRAEYGRDELRQAQESLGDSLAAFLD